MQHVMVVVPVDGEVDEAEYIAQEHRPHLDERARFHGMRNLEFENHHGDQDGDQYLNYREAGRVTKLVAP